LSRVIEGNFIILVNVNRGAGLHHNGPVVIYFFTDHALLVDKLLTNIHLIKLDTHNPPSRTLVSDPISMSKLEVVGIFRYALNTR